MKKLVFLTGAGMSQESGIKAFRDMGGLWEQYDVTEVASIDAWHRNPQLVLDFYNQRRKQLFESQPNKGHQVVAEFEKYFDVNIVTQNVDDLHERVGSSQILHLHGELKKARSTADPQLIYTLKNWELKWGDLCEKGSQLRPHIVWFGEPVPEMDNAIPIVEQADILVIVGTSLSVYPAAGLMHYARPSAVIYLIDPGSPHASSGLKIHHIKEKASIGLTQLFEKLTTQQL
jgi:NAD-dependent deacetylase